MPRGGVPLCRLPQPAPRPLRAGYFLLTTGCQGRAGGVDGVRGRARLGLDTHGTLENPHGGQLHASASSYGSACSMVIRCEQVTVV